jgi:hypothetical protein
MTIFLGTVFFIILVSAPTQAQVTSTPTESIPIPTTSLTPSPTPKTVNYTLPYPGILPGGPLYSLKMVRDKLIDLFMRDSLKKANFYLLQSDKRMASALMLYEKGENDLANTTFSKSQVYLDKSLGRAKQAKNSGEDIGDIFARIKNSAINQKQVIEILSKKSGNKSESFKVYLEKAEYIEKTADSLKP